MSEHRLIARAETIVLVAVGGFAGSNLRYFVGTAFPGLAGTLLVNAAGSLALGFVLYESIYSGRLSRETRFVVATGFLSSLTTYSTFVLEATRHPEAAVGYVAGTYALGFAGVAAGRWLALRVDGGMA